LASIFAGIFVALVLIFFTSFFYYLPDTILGAIVISSVTSLINFKDIKRLYTTHRGDFYVLLTTFLLTLAFGIQQGLFAGIALSLLILIAKVSTPHYAVLGNLNNSQIFRNVDRFPDALTKSKRLILRYDDDIYFGNAQHFFDTILKELKKHDQARELCLDFSSVSNMDSTGLDQFKLLLKVLDKNNIDLHLCGLKGPIRDFFESNGIDDLVDNDHKHWDVKSAVEKLDASI